jgi:hypothetical protein
MTGRYTTAAEREAARQAYEVHPAIGGAHGRCRRCPGGHDVVADTMDDVRDALTAHFAMVHADITDPRGVGFPHVARRLM